VSQDERDAIFGRFHRGRAANSENAPAGTGLGLAIAEEHVHFHGGTIRVEPSSFGGARFVVQIPAVRP
jgi:signal transduction histidine kinase